MYPFTGLRGDAKELWRRARRNQEPKLTLVRADTPQEQKHVLKSSDIVIFATGYQSKHVPVFDQNGQKVHFKMLGSPAQSNVQGPTSTYEVDAHCRLLPINSSTSPAKPLESVVGGGIFGIGLGYSLKTTDNLVQAEMKATSKADSVGLYVKQIGHKLLPLILPGGVPTMTRPKTSSATKARTDTMRTTHQSYFMIKSPSKFPEYSDKSKQLSAHSAMPGTRFGSQSTAGSMMKMMSQSFNPSR